MFNLEQAISAWRSGAQRQGLTPEVLRELESHLRDEVAQQIRDGAEPEKAFDAAVSMLGDPSRLREEFANARVAIDQRQRWAKPIALASAVAITTINSWALVEFDLSPRERVLGAYAVAATAGFVACAPFLCNWLSTLAYVRLMRMVKIGTIIAALIPAILILSALQVIHLQSRPFFELILWLFFAGMSFSVLASSFAETSKSQGRGPFASIAPPSSNMTGDSRALLDAAREEAESLGHDFIGTEHVLLGLLKVENGGVTDLLERSKLCFESVRKEVENLVPPRKEAPGRANIPLTPRARKALQIARKEAVRLRQPLVTPGHVLLGLVLEGSGVGAIILRKMGIRAEHVWETIAARG